MHLKGIVHGEWWLRIYTSWATCFRRGRERGTRSYEGQPKKREKIVWQGDRRVQSSQKWWRNRKNEEKNLVFIKSLAEYFKKRFS
ncbi:MAG: hypothetical protein OZ917_09370 [Candidatus Brocadiaceae bacterium]|nr:hypothetical protein [Candidatus Brocadiaceae bacterium]